MKFGMLAAAAALVTTPLASAQATTLLVTVTGNDSASFKIDSQPVPDYADAFGFMLFGVPAKSPSGSILDVVFYSNVPGSLGGGGGLTAIGFNPGDPLIDGYGELLFTGSTSAPTIRTGSFSLNDLGGVPAYTITIAAVPEPATWAMMIGGFALAGAALRRRRRQRVTVRYAA